MKIEDIKIEDAADANCVIRKFFKDQFKDIKMTQLEQLILTVYNMGKKNGGSAASGSADSENTDAENVETETENTGAAKESANPFEAHTRARTIEDVEIGHSGELIQKGTEGVVVSVTGDTVVFLAEAGEDGEMFEVNIPFEKLEKAE